MHPAIMDKAPRAFIPRRPHPTHGPARKKTQRFVRSDCARKGRESPRLLPRTLSIL